jgi:hypothetical protein
MPTASLEKSLNAAKLHCTMSEQMQRHFYENSNTSKNISQKDSGRGFK